MDNISSTEADSNGEPDGFCSRHFSPHNGRSNESLINISLLLGFKTVILLAVLIVLYLSKMKALEGDTVFGKFTIFPTHRRMFIVMTLIDILGLSFSSIHGITLLIQWDDDYSRDLYRHISYALGKAIFHAVNDGILILFISPGCGRKTLKRGLAFGIIWGTVTFFVHIYPLLTPGQFEDDSRNEMDDDENDNALRNLAYSQDWTILLIVWRAYIISIYVLIWITPNTYAQLFLFFQAICGLKRDRGRIVLRPAARIYSAFGCLVNVSCKKSSTVHYPTTGFSLTLIFDCCLDQYKFFLLCYSSSEI